MEWLKVLAGRTEELTMMSHEIFDPMQYRGEPRKSLRFAPFVVLIALVVYATVVVAALTGPASAQSGTPTAVHVVDAH